MKSLALVLLALTLNTSQTREHWFPTGNPELLTSDTSLTPLMTWDEYKALAANVKATRMVLLNERPPLSEKARFGFNFVLGGQNRGFAMDGSPEKGYQLYLDIDGNGKLTEDEMQSMKLVGERYMAKFYSTLTETMNGVAQSYRVEMTFTLDSAIPPGKTEAIPVLRRCNTTVRRGVIRLSGVEVPFALLGRAGIYDDPLNEVVFDLENQGLDLKKTRAANRFQVSDGKVVIGEATFAFRVDRYGRGLALTATERPMPPRPTLEIGSVAPDFSFADLDGVNHQLVNFRGRVVLLVFWATWCAPCRAEAPMIAEVQKLFRDQGLVVVGINPNDPVADVRQFLNEFQVGGLNMREPLDGPVHKLFRVNAWPAHFLIGKDGRILATDVEVSRLKELIETALRASEGHTFTHAVMINMITTGTDVNRAPRA